MNSRTSADGKYELSLITKDTLSAALAVIQKAFFVDENVSIATRVAENPEAISELTELCVRAAQDGVSLVAIEKTTGKPVAAFFNKIQNASEADEDNYFERFEAKCKHPSSKALMRYMIEMEKLYDIFAAQDVACALEIMFIGTLREHRGKNLGTDMWKFSMEIAQRLRMGDDVKISPTGVKLPTGPAPECVVALATSGATARIAQKFQFQELLEVPFDRFSFEGRTFSERIGPQTKSSTLIFKRLQ